jgi:hypothetical protein
VLDIVIAFGLSYLNFVLNSIRRFENWHLGLPINDTLLPAPVDKTTNNRLGPSTIATIYSLVAKRSAGVKMIGFVATLTLSILHQEYKEVEYSSIPFVETCCALSRFLWMTPQLGRVTCECIGSRSLNPFPEGIELELGSIMYSSKQSWETLFRTCYVCKLFEVSIKLPATWWLPD